MYKHEQESKNTYVPPLQMDAANPFSAAKRSKSSSPYAGTPINVSGKLANRIKDSFGINASELSLRESPEVANMGARATAQGNVIRFAPGQFRPDTGEGLGMLGHELAHIRDQAQGGVHANIPGSNVNYDAGREAASDRAGEAFASGGLSSASPVSLTSASAAPVQGFWLFDKLKKLLTPKPKVTKLMLPGNQIDNLNDDLVDRMSGDTKSPWAGQPDKDQEALDWQDKTYPIALQQYMMQQNMARKFEEQYQNLMSPR